MTVSRAGWPRTRMPAESAVPAVLKSFGLDPSSVERLSPLVSGTGRTRGFRVRVDGQDWALKRYTSPRGVERLSTSHPLELRLADAGFPVAPLRSSAAGETVVQAGRTWYSLRRWVDGQHVSLSDRDEVLDAHPDLLSELAALIATLHLVSGEGAAGWEQSDLDRLLTGPRTNVHLLRRSRRRLLSRWQVLRAKPRKSDFDRWILHVLPEVATRADALAAESIAHIADPSEGGLIHNDVNWDNLILDQSFHVRALLDFDNVVRAPWTLEVGACAVVLAGADPHRVEQFVSGYEATCGSRVDRELVRLGMEHKCVRSITTSVLTYLNGGADAGLIEPWCKQLYQSFREVRRG